MNRQIKTITKENYYDDVNGYMECHLTDCVSSSHFDDGSEKYVFLQPHELIILSKNCTENGFTYTISVRELM